MQEQRFDLVDERGNLIAENMEIHTVLLFVKAYFEKYCEEAKYGDMKITISARKGAREE